MNQRLTRELAQRFVAAAEAGECLPIGPERDRIKYWLPDSVNAKEWLCLIAFDELDDDAAEVLAGHTGRLTLSQLLRLSDASAQSLTWHRGSSLDLDGLVHLSDAAAEALAQYQGILSLNGLTTLSNAAASAFARGQSRVSLNGLTALPDTSEHLALARMLAAQFRSSRNCFQCLTRISEAAAGVLVDLPDFLILDSLQLTEPLATILARHSDGLRFGNSASITEGVARALAKCKGHLVLDVGPSLSPSVADELTAHRTTLSLIGLTCLSEATADILAEHEGPLCLCCYNLTTISEVAARALALHKGPLSLNYFEKLPAAATEILRLRIPDTDDD
jgi:hypothetical protein